VFETSDDLERLQGLIDRSLAGARSEQLLHIFKPKRALTARQLVSVFPGRAVAAVATVAPSGSPRVAPVDLLLVRGRFQLSTPSTTARARDLRRNPRISLTYFEGDDLAVIAHGTATIVDTDHPSFADADAACRHVYESSALDWSESSVYIVVEPETLFAMCRNPGRLAPEDA
jgi:pyridoxamine 5'-phosphate oxidase-like protein